MEVIARTGVTVGVPLGVGTGGAAVRLTADPRLGLAIATGFALASIWIGIALAYYVPSLPPSSAIIGVAVALYALSFGHR